MKTITWKELKEKIEKLTEEQQNAKVLIWGESTPITEAFFDIASEKDCYADDWDFATCESDLEERDNESPGFELIVSKGTPYLNYL